MTDVLYDPLGEATLKNPYPLYDELRENAPIFWHGVMKSWVVTRYGDCLEVLRNHERFARDRRRTGEDIPEFRQSVQSLDPPEQIPLRQLMVTSFKQQNVRAIGGRAQLHLTKLLESRIDLPSFDWMSDVAAPFSLRLAADLLGVPEPDLAEYSAISEGIALRMDVGLVAANAIPGDAARLRLNRLGRRWIQSARTSVGDGFLAQMIGAARRTDIPAHYVENSAAMMFNASFSTVYSTSGNVVGQLLNNPGMRSWIHRYGMVPTVADEMIRFDGPTQGTSRVALDDIPMAGGIVRSGDTVLALIAAANRDPRQFDRPNELVLDRRPNRHLGFGWGPHSCIASLFGRVAVEAVLKSILSIPKPLVPASAPVRRKTATVRSYATLPVSFTA